MDTKIYKIRFTLECLQDIQRIYNYISDNLYANQAAKALMNEVENKVKELSILPKMYPKIPKITNNVYRKLVVKNYVLLYSIDETSKIVYISHMYYGRRNFLK